MSFSNINVTRDLYVFNVYTKLTALFSGDWIFVKEERISTVNCFGEFRKGHEDNCNHTAVLFRIYIRVKTYSAYLNVM